MQLVSLLIAAVWWDADPTDDSENFAEYVGESLGLLLLINLEELCCITSAACELFVCQSLDLGSLSPVPAIVPSLTLTSPGLAEPWIWCKTAEGKIVKMAVLVSSERLNISRVFLFADK